MNKRLLLGALGAMLLAGVGFGWKHGAYGHGS
jgi:hypothetical protein